MGSAVVRDLVATRKDIELGIGDVSQDRAKRLAKESGIGESYSVDVTDIEELSSILSKFEAVVNATWFEYNLNVMKACLKSGCNYNDLGGLFHMTKKQIELDSETRSAGISAVVGGGESPGITNVMCMIAAEKMDTVQTVKIYAGAKETSKTKDLVFPLSVATVIDEYSRNPVEFIDGKYVEVPPLSGDEEVRFLDPVGMNVCHFSLHSEPATLPSSIGKRVKNVEFRLGISQKMLKILSALVEVGLTSHVRNVPVNGQLVSPKEFLISFFNTKNSQEDSLERWVALKTVVAGVRDGSSETVTCDLVAQPGSYGFKNATAFLTGVAGSIFGQHLADNKIPKGVVPPELAIDLKLFSKELQTRGIQIKTSVHKDRN